MRKRLNLRIATALLSCAVWLSAQPTALERYVATPDPAYKFELVDTIAGSRNTTYLLDMVSQNWRSAAEVDRTTWQHWVLIVVPENVQTTTGLLFISGGSNGRRPPQSADPMLVGIARETGAVVAEVRMIPNQPLRFPGEPVTRSEDDFIAYTWDKYLRTGDELWPARLPMTKGAVRAMDTVTAFCRTLPGAIKVDRFVVAGGSKRGWTTWTTAIVDKRVAAIMPTVIDLLNLEKSFIHHWRAYGFWAPAIRAYEKMNIMAWVGRPEFRSLMKIVEPYEYRQRLTLPKYIVNSTGDEFFLPDSSQFYFDDLRGEKMLRYVPNTNHSLKGSDVVQSLQAFFESVIHTRPRPRLTWKLEKNGVIRAQTPDRPAEVKLWQATNPNARDFRLMTIGAAWKSTPVTEQGKGIYTGSAPKPEKGWTAYFLEFTFPSGGKHPLKLTTPVRVVPDVLPFPPPNSTPVKTQTSGARGSGS